MNCGAQIPSSIANAGVSNEKPAVRLITCIEHCALYHGVTKRWSESVVERLTWFLIQATRHGQGLLVTGLLVGIIFPQFALAMRPRLGELIAGLLFLAALRIGPRQAIGAVRDLPVSAVLALVFQLLLPVFAIALFTAFGSIHSPAALALILMLSASPISGSPNLTIMVGHDPAPAFRLLVLGTALLPLTVLPILWLLPAMSTGTEVVGASGRLLGVIFLAAGGAFLIREFLLRDLRDNTTRSIDGLSAIAMSIVVIGLMSAVGPAIAQSPLEILAWAAMAFAANFGIQILTAVLFRHTALRRDFAAFSIIAGNRNIALFLVALPPEIMSPLLIFIGCYQIPMYLTPLLLRRLYAQQP